VSAKGRGKKRRDHDAYYTPDWCTDRLIEDPDLPFDLSGVWLEPAAGGGDIIDAISINTGGGLNDPLIWVAGDIRPKCLPALSHLTHDVYAEDFLLFDFGDLLSKHNRDRFDVLITNPPYSLAEDFMTKGMKIARFTCLFLRVDYLASKSRCSFLRAFPPDVFVLPNRPSFTGDGNTDMTEYAWFVWPQHSRPYGRLKVLAKTAIKQRSNSV